MSPQTDELRTFLRSLPLGGTENAAAVPYLTVCRYTEKTFSIDTSDTPFVFYTADGSVRLHTPYGIMDYIAGQYSLSSVDMPFCGEILERSDRGDLPALKVCFTAEEVLSVAVSCEGDPAEQIAGDRLPESFREQSDKNAAGCLIRLAAALNDGLSLEFMAPHLKKELIFRLLCGSNGSRFLQSIAGTAGAGGAPEQYERILTASEIQKRDRHGRSAVPEKAAPVRGKAAHAQRRQERDRVRA